jgi:hypothetical protein
MRTRAPRPYSAERDADIFFAGSEREFLDRWRHPVFFLYAG